MNIFNGAQKPEAEQVVESLLEKIPNIKTGEIGRCTAVFSEFWGVEDSRRSVETINAMLAILGQARTIEMFTWHSDWQTFLSRDPNYVPLVPPYSIDFTVDPCVASNPEPEPIPEEPV